MVGLQEKALIALKPQELATMSLILTGALTLSNFSSAN